MQIFLQNDPNDLCDRLNSTITELNNIKSLRASYVPGKKYHGGLDDLKKFLDYALIYLRNRVAEKLKSAIVANRVRENQKLDQMTLIERFRYEYRLATTFIDWDKKFKQFAGNLRKIIEGPRREIEKLYKEIDKSLREHHDQIQLNNNPFQTKKANNVQTMINTIKNKTNEYEIMHLFGTYADETIGYLQVSCNLNNDLIRYFEIQPPGTPANNTTDFRISIRSNALRNSDNIVNIGGYALALPTETSLYNSDVLSIMNHEALSDLIETNENYLRFYENIASNPAKAADLRTTRVSAVQVASYGEIKKFLQPVQPLGSQSPAPQVSPQINNPAQTPPLIATTQTLGAQNSKARTSRNRVRRSSSPSIEPAIETLASENFNPYVKLKETPPVTEPMEIEKLIEESQRKKLKLF